MAEAADWDFPRPVSSIKVLLETGADFGLDQASCLANSGIVPAQLEDPAAVVAASQELQVIRNLQDSLGTERALGLEVGSRQHFTTYGIWGFAILSSPTFASAVAVGLRYMLLTSAYCQIRPVITEDEAILMIDDDGLPEDVRDFLVERMAAALVNIQYDLDRANLPVKALRFKRQQPSYAGRYTELFGIQPEYGQAENGLAVDVSCLRLKLPQGNPLTLRYCEEECQRQLNQRRRLSGMAGRVRDRLSRNPTHMPTMQVVADEFAINARTLRRRLADEGLDFESLVDEVRGTLAEELLKNTSLSLEEISERLGYSEPSAFTRAFKRWKSLPPKQYRQMLEKAGNQPSELIALLRSSL